MRFLRVPVLLALVALSGACRGDGPVLPPEDEGLLTGVVEGAEWRGTATVAFRGDTVTFYSRRVNVPAEHHLAFHAVRAPSGTYSLILGSTWRPTAYSETLGGDVLTYQARATAGTLTISHADSRIGRATGSVTLTLQGSRGTWQFQGDFEARGAL